NYQSPAADDFGQNVEGPSAIHTLAIVVAGTEIGLCAGDCLDQPGDRLNYGIAHIDHAAVENHTRIATNDGKPDWLDNETGGRAFEADFGVGAQLERIAGNI